MKQTTNANVSLSSLYIMMAVLVSILGFYAWDLKMTNNELIIERDKVMELNEWYRMQVYRDTVDIRVLQEKLDDE